MLTSWKDQVWVSTQFQGSRLKSPFLTWLPSHPTLAFISGQKLKDGVHGPHVEDEPQLSDTHGDKAEQQDGAEDTLHEGRRSYRRKNRVFEKCSMVL